ncbi:hypothetical protein [Endothiovibrio diazotrophicus]
MRFIALAATGLLAGAFTLPTLADEAPAQFAAPAQPAAPTWPPMPMAGRGMPMPGGGPMMGGRPGYGYGPGMRMGPAAPQPMAVDGVEEGAAGEIGEGTPPCPLHRAGPGTGRMAGGGNPCPMKHAGYPGRGMGPGAMGGYPPMMMSGRPMMWEHMATVETRLANIEALLRELVELRKQAAK